MISDLRANGNKIKENGKERKEHLGKFCVVTVRLIFAIYFFSHLGYAPHF